MNGIKAALESFRDVLTKNSDPARAKNEKAYLKSPYKFFGVTVPFIDKMAKGFMRENKDASKEFIFKLAAALWASEYHQEKSLAIRILGMYPRYLDIESMPVLESMIDESTGWDHVDAIANHLVDAALRNDKAAYKYLKKWGRSENFWLRRASLISQILLFREGKGDKELFFKLAESMAGEKEFFIRKAIGWTLREMSKADPDSAFEFLMKIKSAASNLTLREGSKRLGQKQRDAVMAG